MTSSRSGRPRARGLMRALRSGSGRSRGWMPGGRGGGHVAAGAAGADEDAVVAGELVKGLDGAADLGGDVGQGTVPGEVFLAKPGWVEVDHAGLLARGPAGWLGCGEEGAADWAAGPGQRVPEQHLAQVAEEDAQVRRDLEGRGPVVQQGAVDGGGIGSRGSAPFPRQSVPRWVGCRRMGLVLLHVECRGPGSSRARAGGARKGLRLERCRRGLGAFAPRW
jgi:hypothetical protein